MLMTRRRILVAAATAVLALGTGFTPGKQMQAEDAAGIGSIKTSYAFDVKDKRTLLNHASAVFVAEIIGAERTDESAASTVWRVRVVQSLKGTRTGEILVRQLGYVDSARRVHAAEEQPMLVPGGRRLLVTTGGADGGPATLLAGPAASVDVGDSVRQAQVTKEYQSALE
ncbi:hypothetical protein ACFCV3_20300 [Kribbella sp. NPDC056345]|uniref:hypothetical protein n=1 Tax=Kribbella sp. NPDC056345 TaxID=3345789 RepID=UPI0035E2ED4F